MVIMTVPTRLSEIYIPVRYAIGHGVCSRSFLDPCATCLGFSGVLRHRLCVVGVFLRHPDHRRFPNQSGSRLIQDRHRIADRDDLSYGTGLDSSGATPSDASQKMAGSAAPDRRRPALAAAVASSLEPVAHAL